MRRDGLHRYLEPRIGVRRSEATMSLRGKFFAATYDRQIARSEKAGLRAFRQQLLTAAAGDVLEIGGGTGANLPYHGADVPSLIITAPDAPMLRPLEPKARQRAPAAT